ncbi:MAG: UDP-3-O-acyl-N-acetylglucosamine deacetylase [Prevotellaceae bacterium]|nr:UDP-3-O-acyl-N-acetylglucosamine deacetylase [Candidatus Colivivens equi]
MKQITLKSSFRVESIGLHTGRYIHAEFCPAPENHGYKIQRTDIDGHPVIECLATNVVETQRGTVIANGDVRVSTIEHAMAALYASRIDNVLIKLDGPEMPIMDGSAMMFINKIYEVGLQEQNAEKQYLVIPERRIEVKGQNGELLIAVPDDKEMSVQTMITFDSEWLANQEAELNSLDDFAGDIASARTFVFVRELMPLVEAGLIKGGDLDNAIVIYENELPQDKYDFLADKMKVPHQDAKKLGYLNHRPLVWKNEPARHKLLDIIGDMALIGHPIKGRIIAVKPGHTINNVLARKLQSYGL